MTERDMVMDVLSGVKASIGSYSKSITECGNTKLRETFKQMRNSAEKFQYDLYQVAAKKGYYVECPSETPEQCQKIKVQLSEMLSTLKTSGPVPVMS